MTALRILPIVFLAGWLAGCSHPPQTPELVFPAGFTGYFKIQHQPGHAGGPKPVRGRLVIDVPADGVCRLGDDAYLDHFAACIGWLPRYDDGTPIPLFSPAVPVNADPIDPQQLLGLIQIDGTIYGVIDNHVNLIDTHRQLIDRLRDGQTPDLDQYFRAAPVRADTHGTPL